MKCSICKQQLADFHEGRLTESELKEVRTHLADCPSCVRESDEVSRTLSILHELPLPDLSESYWAGREHSILEGVKESPLPSGHMTLWDRLSAFIVGRNRMWQPVLATGMVIAMMISLNFYFHNKPETQTPDLSPEIASTICEDPLVWANVVWLSEENADNTEQTSQDGRTDFDSILTVLASSDESTDSSDSDAAMDQESLWSLIDDLDEQGRDLLISEFSLSEKA